MSSLEKLKEIIDLNEQVLTKDPVQYHVNKLLIVKTSLAACYPDMYVYIYPDSKPEENSDLDQIHARLKHVLSN